MTDIHDNTTKADARSGKKIPPYLVTLTDKERDVRYFSNDGLLEPANGWLWKQCTGDGSTTSFSFDQALPANVHVVNTAIYVSGTSGTAATTVALGKSGTTGAYQAASNFTSSMNTAGAKASTTVKAHETASVTPLVTFSAAWDSGAKLLAGIQYAKAPAIV
jgi:hypothetical protein